jgi:molybdate transport system ATP-binding protein
VLTIASSGVNGPVLVAVPPQAIALSVAEPSGSQRNTWLTEVEHLEPFGDRVRVTTGGPVPLTAEVTPGAVTDLDLTPGAPVWVAIKATELRATPID